MEHDPESAGPTAERMCARCRQSFAGDATLLFQNDWWLCETCQPILMPSQRPSPATTP